MYANAIKKEQAKLKPSKDDSSESEGEMSVNVVETVRPIKKKRQITFDFSKKSKSSEEKTPEEKAFLKKVMAEEANSEQDDSVISDANSDA